MAFVVIRLARKSDAKDVIAYRNEVLKRGFGKYLGSNWILGANDARRYGRGYAAGKRNEFVLVAVDKRKHRVVGNCGFFAKERGRIRHRGNMGWTVNPDYLKRGIATRLVKATLKEAKRRGFTRAEAEAAVKNVASVRLAKKCGFKMEGRRKNGLLLDNGKYVDTYLFGKIL